MSSLTLTPASSPQGLYQQSATQMLPLGTTLTLGDGREFVYAKNGSVTGVAGNIYQSPSLDLAGPYGAITNHLNCSVVAAAIGDKYVDVILGATAVTENYYAEGQLQVVDGTGEGVSYKVTSHAAAASSGTVRVYLADPVIEALVASGTSEVSLIPNMFKDVIIHPAPPSAPLVGVAIRDFTAAYFGWFQTKGLCAVLTTGTVVAGNLVIASITVDGSVDPVSTTYAVTAYPVGRVHTVRGTGGEYGTIDLNIV